jgi:Uma2 family endonuclease
VAARHRSQARRVPASGVGELWLVDTPANTVLVYRKVESLDGASEVGPGETLTSPLLPGFALPIDELFA